MSQFLKIDKNGLIIGAADFSEDDTISEDYKKAWDANTILMEPCWNFIENKWFENIDTLKFLQDKKENKKVILGEICQNKILSGFIFNFNGVDYLFSFDDEAQKNMSDRFNLFQSQLIEIVKITAHTLDGIDVRLDFNQEFFNDLYLTSVFHKEDNIGKYRDVLIPKIDNSTSVEEVEAINWDSK